MIKIRRYSAGLLLFFDNLLVYLLRKSPKRSPMYVSWDLTRRCNSYCRFCYSWKENYTSELSREQKIKVINDLCSFRPWVLSLSGGEPLLDEDLQLILEHTHKNKMNVNICTNGLLLREWSDFLIDKNVTSVTISADSDIASEHDSGRGVEGLFDKICDGIEYFKSRRSSVKNQINIRLLIHAKNIAKLDQMIAFWKKKVDSVLLQPINNSSIKEYREELTDLLDFKAGDFDQFEYILKKHNIYNMHTKGIPYLFGEQELCYEKCYSSFFFVHVDQRGDVWNCPLNKFKLGNVKDNSMKNILSSSRASQRKQAIRDMLFCKCNYNCATINNFLKKLLFFK